MDILLIIVAAGKSVKEWYVEQLYWMVSR